MQLVVEKFNIQSGNRLGRIQVGGHDKHGAVLAPFGREAEFADEYIAAHEAFVVVILPLAGVIAVVPAKAGGIVVVVFIVLPPPAFRIVFKINPAITAHDAFEIAVFVQTSEMGHLVGVFVGLRERFHAGGCAVAAAEGDANLVNCARILVHNVLDLHAVPLPGRESGVGVQRQQIHFFLQDDFAHALQFVFAFEIIHLEILQHIGVEYFKHFDIHGAQAGGFEGEDHAAGAVFGNNHAAAGEADGGFHVLKRQRPIAAAFHSCAGDIPQAGFHAQLIVAAQPFPRVQAHKIAVHHKTLGAVVPVEANHALQVLVGLHRIGKIEQSVLLVGLHDPRAEHDKLVQRGNDDLRAAVLPGTHRPARPFDARARTHVGAREVAYRKVVLQAVRAVRPGDFQRLIFLRGRQDFFGRRRIKGVVGDQPTDDLLFARIGGIGRLQAEDFHLESRRPHAEIKTEFRRFRRRVFKQGAQTHGSRVGFSGRKRLGRLEEDGAVVFPNRHAGEGGADRKIIGRYRLPDLILPDCRLRKTHAQDVRAADIAAGVGIDVIRDGLVIGLVANGFFAGAERENQSAPYNKSYKGKKCGWVFHRTEFGNYLDNVPNYVLFTFRLIFLKKKSHYPFF